MCGILDRSKAFKTEALLPKNNLSKEAAKALSGLAIPCKCGKKLFFEYPGNPGNIVEIRESVCKQ